MINPHSSLHSPHSSPFAPHLPNILTLCNLLCGCLAAACGARGAMEAALGLIVLGCVFDFCDGLAARLLGVASRLGVELDSLADVVTSGVAPAMMVHAYMIRSGAVGAEDMWVSYLPFLLTAFAALRLAKFNIDERQHTAFLGLPTPANALFWAALVVGGPGLPLPAYVVLIVVACCLMICPLPMIALKFSSMGWKQNWFRFVFLAGGAVLLLFFGVAGLAWAVVWYVVLSLILGKMLRG